MSAFTKRAVIRDFNRASSRYDEYASVQRMSANRLYAIAHSNLNNSSQVLDIGAGTGYFHELLRKNKIYCPLIQLDIAENMCKKAEEYASSPPYGSTHTVCADMDFIPFVPESFDFAFSSLTLQWSHDISVSLDQIYQAINNKGVAAFNVLVEGSLYELSDTIENIFGRIRVNNFIESTSVLRKVEEAGFYIIKSELQDITTHHKDIKSLLYSIKGVGASYKTGGGYPGRDYFAKLENIYKNKHGTQEGLPLSWKILHVVAKK